MMWASFFLAGFTLTVVAHNEIANYLIGSGSGDDPAPLTDPCSSLAYWMQCASEKVRQRPLPWLALPGSHDSFAYTFPGVPKNNETSTARSSIFAPDMSSEQINMLNMFAVFQGPDYVKDVIANWSLTQRLDFMSQLNAGVRYFDIRIGMHPETGKLHFLHGLWCEEAFPALEQLAFDFLPSHPHEVVLLDFNHFYSMEISDHYHLAKFLLDTFDSTLIKRRFWHRANNITLEKASRFGQQVIVFYHDLHFVFHLAKGAFWSGFQIPSRWPQTADLSKLHEVLDEIVRSHEEGEENANRTNFLVYQSVLTPDAGTIIFNLGNPKASLQSVLAEEATHKFVHHWLPRIIEYHKKNKTLPLPPPKLIKSSRKTAKTTPRPRKIFGNGTTTTSTTSTTTTTPETTTTPRPRPAQHFYLGTFNIFIADFIEVANFTKAVIDLNEIL